jgi:hypothetical protein
MNCGGACPALLPRAGADRGWTGSLGPLLGTAARRDRCRADLPYAEPMKRKLVWVVLFSVLFTGLSSVRPKRRRVLNRPFKTSWCARHVLAIAPAVLMVPPWRSCSAYCLCSAMLAGPAAAFGSYTRTQPPCCMWRRELS